jgi:hypothetical protein
VIWFHAPCFYLSNWWKVEIIGDPLTGKSLYELDGVGHGCVSV